MYPDGTNLATYSYARVLPCVFHHAMTLNLLTQIGHHQVSGLLGDIDLGRCCINYLGAAFSTFGAVRWTSARSTDELVRRRWRRLLKWDWPKFGVQLCQVGVERIDLVEPIKFFDQCSRGQSRHVEPNGFRSRHNIIGDSDADTSHA